MTSRNTTQFLPLRDDALQGGSGLSDDIYRIAFGAIGWPWLLVSLWGGTKASKRRLLSRVGLAPDALPHLGSWKADTGFLHHIVDAIETLRPRNVVELGAGASTLVCAKALEMNGGGKLYSYDQHAAFVRATADWIASEGAAAELRHAPLQASIGDWPGRWYDLDGLPETIDLLVIDGPPWTIHPYVRGAAEALFDRLSPGAIILLDDAARPGERIIARRWRENWPGIAFERAAGSTKGTLIGRKKPQAQIIAMPRAEPVRSRQKPWRRAAAMLALIAGGWIAHDFAGELSSSAQAASFLEEADASYAASVARQRMHSQPESTLLDRAEIAEATGLAVPRPPRGWELVDVQVYPADLGMSVVMVMDNASGETVSLYAARAETPAEKLPLLERRDERSVAYWEEGPVAYALTGAMSSEQVLALAAELAR